MKLKFQKQVEKMNKAREELNAAIDAWNNVAELKWDVYSVHFIVNLYNKASETILAALDLIRTMKRYIFDFVDAHPKGAKCLFRLVGLCMDDVIDAAHEVYNDTLEAYNVATDILTSLHRMTIPINTEFKTLD